MMLRKSTADALDAFRVKFVQTYACWFPFEEEYVILE